MKKIWMPLPMSAANNRGCRGGLNTSPCTNFQPVSSSVSVSKLSSVLYRAMSLRRVRTMIMVRIPERKKTTTREFIILNQWICTLFIPR